MLAKKKRSHKRDDLSPLSEDLALVENGQLVENKFAFFGEQAKSGNGIKRSATCGQQPLVIDTFLTRINHTVR